MILGLAVALQIAAAAPPPNLVVREGGGNLRIVPSVATLSGRYLRADLLAAALGGSAGAMPGGRYSISLGGQRIDLAEGVPFVRIGADVVPMNLAPLRSGQTFLVPFQLAASVIPRFTTGFNFDASVSEIRIFDTSARRGVAPPPARAEESSPLDAGTQPLPVRPRRAQRRLVVVDAGHGGVDPGMQGPIGAGPRITEKHVTLSVSRMLEEELRRQGVEVMMTRTRDTLIALSDRGRIANRNKGDLFVSIHVNASGNRSSAAARQRGYETYFLAEAKTAEASRVERMENEAVKFETGANAPKGDPLSFIINDMAQNEHLRESNDLAETIQNGLRRFHPGRDRGVQQANFAVLRGSFMPAVLVEIGFGTNPEEAEYLNDRANQRRIAQSLAVSIMEYLGHYDARIGSGTR
ncbi:MAG: N-acetylmuramoyl-L-alanine amidase family protein [Gemmatimonadaceae bacterium]